MKPVKETQAATSIFDKMSLASHLTKKIETEAAPEVSKIRKELLCMADLMKVTPDMCDYRKSFDSFSDDNLASWMRHHVSKLVSEREEKREIDKAVERILKYLYFGPRNYRSY